MAEVRAFQPVVEAAEKAAGAGDFATAEALLRDAADLQEAELGSLHPDLASTFNNLAVVCEIAEKPADAEQFYRRAYAIAMATLAPEDALTRTSRDNLRDFCQTRGLPLDEWAGQAPAGLVAPAPTSPSPEPEAPPPAPRAPRTANATRPQAPAAVAPPGRSSRRPWLWTAVILAVLATAAGARLWLTRLPGGAADVSRAAAPGAVTPAAPTAPAATVEPTPAPAVEPAPAAPVPSPSAAAPVVTGPAPPASAPPAVAPAGSGRTERGDDASTPADVRVVTATVCRTLTTSGAWNCAPTGATTSPGSVAFYTRIASPQPIQVRHRWYQDDQLRQDVALRLGVNTVEGYRTFSRRSVGPGEWRVELRAENGALLDEGRFVVR